MKRYGVILAITLVLVGCGSKEKEAQALVDQARALWDQVMPSPPEDRGGSMAFNKESISMCVTKLDQAKASLDKVAASYSDTEVWGSTKTKTLNERVRSQSSTCNQVKNAQGW